MARKNYQRPNTESQKEQKRPKFLRAVLKRFQRDDPDHCLPSMNKSNDISTDVSIEGESSVYTDGQDHSTPIPNARNDALEAESSLLSEVTLDPLLITIPTSGMAKMIENHIGLDSCDRSLPGSFSLQRYDASFLHGSVLYVTEYENVSL